MQFGVKTPHKQTRTRYYDTLDCSNVCYGSLFTVTNQIIGHTNEELTHITYGGRSTQSSPSTRTLTWLLITHVRVVAVVTLPVLKPQYLFFNIREDVPRKKKQCTAFSHLI